MVTFQTVLLVTEAFRASLTKSSGQRVPQGTRRKEGVAFTCIFHGVSSTVPAVDLEAGGVKGAAPGSLPTCF